MVGFPGGAPERLQTQHNEPAALKDRIPFSYSATSFRRGAITLLVGRYPVLSFRLVGDFMWFKYVRPVLVAAVTMMVTASAVVAQEKKGVPPSDPALNTLVAAFAGVALETLGDPDTINQLIIEDPQVLESYRAQLQRATSGYLARVSNPDPRVVTRLASLQMALQAAIMGIPILSKPLLKAPVLRGCLRKMRIF